ncbi:hypothetical protein EPN87_02940 [archaeon]|nr:MAG: hypothetical protein EPN87_02940 [archaeon]
MEAYEIKEYLQNERMLKHLKPYLANPQSLLHENIFLKSSDARLPVPELRSKLAIAMIQYLVATDGSATSNGMIRHFGINGRLLNKLILKAYERDLSPEYVGGVINMLRKHSGADYSYLEEVAGKTGIVIGGMDITKDMRVPNAMDENVERAAGWLSTAPYSEAFYMRNDRKIPARKSFDMSFRNIDALFVEHEVLPFFWGYHNYSPSVRKKADVLHNRPVINFRVTVEPRSIVSFYRNIGITKQTADRKILFDGASDAFMAGLVDCWGSVYNSNGAPSLNINVNSRFGNLLKELQERFGRGNKRGGERTHDSYSIHLAKGGSIIDFMRKYPISNPRLLYPMEYYMQFRKYPEAKPFANTETKHMQNV